MPVTKRSNGICLIISKEITIQPGIDTIEKDGRTYDEQGYFFPLGSNSKGINKGSVDIMKDP